MRSLILFDLSGYSKHWAPWVVMAIITAIGTFIGFRFNLTVGEGVFINSPYSSGFLLGLLSLSVIFVATVFAIQLLFREWDTRMDEIVFSTPITIPQFTSARMISLIVLSALTFLLLSMGFAVGQHLRTGTEMASGLHVWRYVYPFLLFGLPNCLFVCSILSLVAWSTKNKLLVALSGLFLYILYMVILVFSNSPFLAQSSPQSLGVQHLAALADPFGLSAYFWESRNYSVTQRNTTWVPVKGALLVNRLAFSALSILFLYLAGKSFSVGKRKKPAIAGRRPRSIQANWPLSFGSAPFQVTATQFGPRQQTLSIFSFAKADLSYIFKSIPLVMASLLLLFFLGMEIYGDITQGIRIPEQFASSGLIASTITENLQRLGLLLVVYYVNDIYWRSSISRFSILENTTFFSGNKKIGHWLSLAALVLFFTGISIILGLLFQWAYHYDRINWSAYGGLLVFNTWPLLLLSGCLLLLNGAVRHKYLALAVSILVTWLVTGSFIRSWISSPLIHLFVGFKEGFSDFSGYDSYLKFFSERFIFGSCFLLLAWWFLTIRKRNPRSLIFWLYPLVLAAIGIFASTRFMKGYIPRNKSLEMGNAANYERKFRKYQHLPQPVITAVATRIHLYPSSHYYLIEGTYTVKNLDSLPVHTILVNFHKDLEMQEAFYACHDDSAALQYPVTELKLRHPLRPKDSATLHFKLSYAWHPVNSLDPANAILSNGSFMRISRYYPQLGYQSEREITNLNERQSHGLGPATSVKTLEDPRTTMDDFIKLDMEVSTEENQTAIGTGELISRHSAKHRNYFHYRTPVPVPFRFAVASAEYAMKSVLHGGIKICVYYNPKHHENVDRLLYNAGLTLDYCRQNFGPYPFSSICFAEISSFAKGFNGTAYPGEIFMNENITFHANLEAGHPQDVINELAAHELSHLWWGCSQIAPDNREGAPMLTETLAMYTEMMLYKQMYGPERMKERLMIQQQIYEAEKGFASEQPLYRVTADNPHISYAKGALVMVRLSELIGEQKLNLGLRNFLQTWKYPGERPISTDLINEIMKVSDLKWRSQIDSLFMGVTDPKLSR